MRAIERVAAVLFLGAGAALGDAKPAPRPAAHEPTPAEAALAAQLELLNPAALGRLADDWAATWGTNAAAQAVRAFAAALDARRSAARAALTCADAAPARALLAEHRRVVARHPLVKDLRILSLKHIVDAAHARRDEHPTAPWFSCYNGLDAAKGNDTKIVALSGFADEAVAEAVLFDPPGRGSIHAMDLHWDAGRAVFSHVPANTNVWRLYEADLRTGAGMALLPDAFAHEADDCCYLPDDKVVFTSDAAEQGLPCESGRWRMTNMYRLDPATKAIMRLTYDQDSDWYPSVLNDGRIQYVRWEYCDISHYFSRIVMTMRPDGTRQMGFYGSNGYWPNHFGSPLAIPGDNGKFVCIATGHHTPKSGKIALFDANRARAEAAGCVQLVPGWGKTPKDRVMDRLYQGDYPTALTPYPLGTTPQDGAGKYFLCAMKPSKTALWGIYLVDVFDNVTLLMEEEGTERTEPIAWRARKRPPVLPDTRRENVGDCTVYVGDVHEGPGLKNVPRGTVKSVRLFAYHYGFNHAASHEGMGVESSWDAKYVLGTAPVDERGTVFFTAPVNTPISIQPLDAEGRAVQLMRSWLVGMPGEHVSCLGCHENANAGSTHVPVIKGAPAQIAPMAGLAKPRAWSFLREVQPILVRRCSGCHADDPDPVAKTKKPGLAGCPDADGVWVYAPEEQAPFLTATKPNLTDIRPTALLYGKVDEKAKPEFSAAGAFARSYWYLQRYVRRPGPESDNHLFNPGEYHASTSPLVQLLKAGHHGVRLTDDEWRALYTWIDLNAPFWGKWNPPAYASEAPDPKNPKKRSGFMWAGEEDQVARRLELQKRYANVPDNPEAEHDAYHALVTSRVVKAVAPAPKPAPAPVPKLAGWPMDVLQSAKAQLGAIDEIAPVTTKTLVLGGGQSLTFRRIPAGQFVMGSATGYPDERPMAVVRIDRPFWISEMEIRNDQYNVFDPEHDSRYQDEFGKDHVFPGHVGNHRRQPVVRVTWHDAMRFCQWLSKTCGVKANLPTEAQWEWAARAGTATPFPWGGLDDDFSKFANFADRDTRYQVVGFDGGGNIRRRHPFRIDQNYPLHDERFLDDWFNLNYVGRANCNRWGLYDMHGNASEWTRSDYAPYPYVDGDGRNACDPKAKKVARGGSYASRPRDGTSSYRLCYEPWQTVFDVGFRVILECE